MANPLKVLIVDDDRTCREMIDAVLSELGHTVLTRDNPLGTSAEILRERPDVVLLDINMPTLSGDELLRTIRQGSLADIDWEPQFIFVSVPNSREGPGVVDVIRLGSGFLRQDTNVFQDGIQSIQVPAANGLMGFVRQ